MTSKCPFFDKGFCKNKIKCTQKHPPQDCHGECEDLNSCENLHPETWEQELQPNSEKDTLKTIQDGYGKRITDIEEKTFYSGKDNM